jgi:nitrogen fixation protein NifT
VKILLRRVAKGLSAYIPKKDLEEPVVAAEREGLWGGWIRLKNGWTFDLPEMAPETALPITVNARKRGGEEDT